MRLFLSALFAFILIAPEVGAQSCGTSVCTGSETCLAGDGVIADAGGVGGCGLYFMGSFGFPGDAALDDYGGFPAGTQVHVEGCAVAYFGTCSLTWSIRDNTIETLTPPVPALGRSGRVLTVLLVLGIGSFGIWRFRDQHP
jgi:hypothetical protein